MKHWTRTVVSFVAFLNCYVLMAGEVRASANEYQRIATAELQKISSENFNIKWDDQRGVAKFVSGKLTESSELSQEELAFSFIKQYKILFGIQDLEQEIALESINVIPDGYFITFKQKKSGMEVIGGKITVRIYKGIITTVANYFEPNVPVKTMPTLSLEEAESIARKDLGIDEKTAAAGLVIFHWEGKFCLTYRIDFAFDPHPEPSRYRVYVDAHNGTIVLAENRVMYAGAAVGTGTGIDGTVKSFDTYEQGGIFYLGNAPLVNAPSVTIRTCTANNIKVLPGNIMKDSNNLWEDPAGVDAHFYGNYVFDFYKNNFSNFSWSSGSGFAAVKGLLSTVHYGTDFENAFWNGTQMVYGDGGSTFLPFSGSLDVVAHEITHGITEAINNLIYSQEPGALNESWSDVMGMFTSIDYGDDRPYWMAENILKNNQGPYYAMRRLDDPPFRTDSYPENNYNPQDPLNSWGQPEHTSEQYHAGSWPWTDNGGVHENSGIPNKAAYLITTHASVGVQKAKQIYYYAMFYLSANSQFVDARDAVEQATIDLYGIGQELTVVRAAFDAVGIQ